MAITLDSVGSGYNLSVMNTNFEAIQDFLNDVAIKREVDSEEEANEMRTFLDMNHNRIVNVPSPVDDNDVVNKATLLEALEGIEGVQGVRPLVQNRQYGDGVNLVFDTPANDLQHVNGFFVNISGATQRPIEDYEINSQGQVVFLGTPPPNGMPVDITFFEPTVILPEGDSGEDGDTIYQTYQYSDSESGPWSDVALSTYTWRRHNWSVNGVIDNSSWSVAFKFVGTDGADGEDGAPGGGGGDVYLSANNTFTGDNKFDEPVISLEAPTLGTHLANKTFVEDAVATALSNLYPVGSVVMRMDIQSPASIYGGTWTLLTGDASLSFGDGSLQNGVASGSNSVAVPLKDHSHTGPSHSHSGPSHSHTMGSHTHSGTVTDSGAHDHNYLRNVAGPTVDDGTGSQVASSGQSSTNTTDTGNHSHVVTIGTGGSGSTSAAGTGSTGSAGAGDTSTTGDGTNPLIDVRGSTITINVWQRTA